MKPRGGPNESARHAMAMRGEALFVLDFLFYFLIKQLSDSGLMNAYKINTGE